MVSLLVYWSSNIWSFTIKSSLSFFNCVIVSFVDEKERLRSFIFDCNSSLSFFSDIIALCKSLFSLSFDFVFDCSISYLFFSKRMSLSFSSIFSLYFLFSSCNDVNKESLVVTFSFILLFSFSVYSIFSSSFIVLCSYYHFLLVL